MKITGLKSQVKNPDRVSVFLDGKYSFSLTLDQLLESGLKKDDELEDSDVVILKKLSEDGKMKARALEWVLNRPRSLQEFQQYCYRKKIDLALCNSWQTEFQTKNYLNDGRFTDWFVELRARKSKSKRSIVQELIGKGIDRSIAEKSVQAERQNDTEAINKLVDKLQSRSRYQDERKLITYLLGKGFSYQDIKNVLQARAGAD